MAGHGYGGVRIKKEDLIEDEIPELRPLNLGVADDPDSFDAWEKLVRTVQGLEGGLGRNSGAQAISAARDVFDRFLAKFPLFFGYWKKYADLEFSIAGTEAAELVYERGVASINTSVDLWAQYCAFKVETSHDPEIIRELFERGAESVGLDFLGHPFWDKYIEYEERLEAHDRVFALLYRIIQIPMHQYSRYFEKFRNLTSSRPISELAEPEKVAQLQSETQNELARNPSGDVDIERELRVRLDDYHVEILQQTQAESTKRWTYEQEVKRPYFHVTELEDGELGNWRKYLDFEEKESNYERTVFLYERCLVAVAYYDEFWLRYARWMSSRSGKTEEVRNIYQRASFIYAPISRPQVRLQWALFEEMEGRLDIAADIYKAILLRVPGNIETCTAWANFARRHPGSGKLSLHAAQEVYEQEIRSQEIDANSKASLVGELGRLFYTANQYDQARSVFHRHRQEFRNNYLFWDAFLGFEIRQASGLNPPNNHEHHRVRDVYAAFSNEWTLTSEDKKKLLHQYQVYLLECGTANHVAKEFLDVDRAIHV